MSKNIIEKFNLEGRVAIVTGALGLIGKEICKALAEAGGSVVVCDLDKFACEEFAFSLGNDSIGGDIDVTKIESIKDARYHVLKKYGHIDILVNNAAINDMVESPVSALEQSMFENYPLEIWQKVIDVNLTGVFLCSQIFGKEMLKQKKGSIINIASTYGIVAPDQNLYKNESGEQKFYKSPVYPATKGAVISFTKYLASYWGNKGIRVNALSPGGVENHQDEFFIKSYSSKTLLGRMAKNSDYKGALVFLASDASEYMTGANLVVDGGWTAI
jgi:NAD(P)-dependent dehydrogenase (short-subunit alcohol dehydrogenase family)